MIARNVQITARPLFDELRTDSSQLMHVVIEYIGSSRAGHCRQMWHLPSSMSLRPFDCWRRHVPSAFTFCAFVSARHRGDRAASNRRANVDVDDAISVAYRAHNVISVWLIAAFDCEPLKITQPRHDCSPIQSTVRCNSKTPTRLQE